MWAPRCQGLESTIQRPLSGHSDCRPRAVICSSTTGWCSVCCHITITNIGAGARYYFDQIGIYAGLTAKYAHFKVSGVNGTSDFRPEINVGYAYFLSHHITLEPEIYYEHSFKDTDYSGFGLRLGCGIYF